jgi:chromosome segregation ATPase
LTRVLRRDGKYWFEIDNVHATKGDVVRLLSHFNVDPDNMLIIMHQDMAEQFVVLSPQEKLKLIEAAAGLESYRRNVLEARKKLSRILSQEDSLKKMLESAEQTLNYWREQYDRHQQKRQLILKRRFLEREYAWAEVTRLEEELAEVQRRLEAKRYELERINEEIRVSEEAVSRLVEELKDAKAMWERSFEERLRLEREKAKHEFNIQNSSRVTAEIQAVLESGQQRIEEFLEAARLMEGGLQGSPSGGGVPDQASRILSTAEEINDWSQKIVSKVRNLQESVKESDRRLSVLEAQLSEVKERMQKSSEMLEDLNGRILEKRIDLAILRYRGRETESDIREIEKTLRSSRSRVAEATRRAEERGPRVATLRSPEEVLDEIRIVDGRIAAMADIPGDVERMYESYSKLYLELREKARLAAENREKALAEVERRMIAWRNLIRDLLSSVSSQYQKILSHAGGAGYVSLINDHDIEAAGIEINVGFRGTRPIPLNIYSQSGGERSTAVMAFLLALQQHIRSPFRAIDEYDVHMDPRNREVIANLLISAVEGAVQYLAITPNQMYFEGRDVHMITVQNIEGTSVIMEVKG